MPTLTLNLLRLEEMEEVYSSVRYTFIYHLAELYCVIDKGFVGFDGSLGSVIVAHQGTDPFNL
jgi:hypothetical protein